MFMTSASLKKVTRSLGVRRVPKRIHRVGADAPLIVAICHPLSRKTSFSCGVPGAVYNTYRCNVSTDLQRLLRFSSPPKIISACGTLESGVYYLSLHCSPQIYNDCCA